MGDTEASIREGRGPLVVFEGPDGVGKTTLAKALAHDLDNEGYQVADYSFPGTDPETLGGFVYRLHHDARSLGLTQPIPAASRQLLHVAAHIDLIERRILPRLEQGVCVILDRYWWSTWAYGLDTGVPEALLRQIVDVEKSVWGTELPDVLFLVQRESPLSMPLQNLWRSYDALARREASRYRVRLIRNVGSVPEALSEVRGHLPRLGKE